MSGIDGDGFALRMTVEAEGTEITLGVFDETEFVQLAIAANDKVNAEL